MGAHRCTRGRDLDSTRGGVRLTDAAPGDSACDLCLVRDVHEGWEAEECDRRLPDVHHIGRVELPHKEGRIRQASV